MSKVLVSQGLASPSQIRWANIVLLLVAVIWGASYSLAKGALDYTPVLVFLAIRFGVTSLLLLPFTIKELANSEPKVWFNGVQLGAILFLIFLAETYGVAHTSASNAAFLISLCIVFTPIIDSIWQRKLPPSNILMAALLCIAGTWVLTSSKSLQFNLGDGLILVAALLRALMVTYTKRVTDKIKLSSLALTQLQMCVVFIASVVVMLVSVENITIPNAIDFWWRLIVIVIFCTLFAFFAQNYGVKHSNPTRASFLMGTEPLFGAMFAIYLLSEPLTLQLFFGGMLISSGTYIGMKLTRA